MKIKIIAGEYRNRNITVPDDQEDVRPSKSIVRESGFNMITSRIDLQDCYVLDLFCGCGALGIEAISRGASHVTFVDKNIKPTKVNTDVLEIEKDRFQLKQTDALYITPQNKAHVVLADPPYERTYIKKLLERKDEIAHPESLWLLETESFLKLDPTEYGFEVLKEKKFGKSKLWLLQQL